MSRLQVRPLLAVAALAAISGCAAETGYQLPELPQSGGGVYAPYSVYRPGYYFGYPGYDPRYYGYGAYNPYAYQGGPYPYGYGLLPLPALRRRALRRQQSRRALRPASRPP